MKAPEWLYLDEWKDFLQELAYLFTPTTRNELFEYAAIAVCLSAVVAIAAVKARHRKGSWFGIVLATPFAFFLSGEIITQQGFITPSKAVAIVMFTVVVQWFIAWRTLRKPKHMYFDPNDYPHLN